MTGSLAGPGGRFLSRLRTAPMTDDVLRVVALLVPCLLGLWTAVACRRAQYHGLPGSDALVWAGCRLFLLSLMKTARGLACCAGSEASCATSSSREAGTKTAGPCRSRRASRSQSWSWSCSAGACCGVGTTSGDIASPRLRGPAGGLRDYSFHFSARGRRMERERALGTHGRRSRRGRWGIGGGHRPA